MVNKDILKFRQRSPRERAARALCHLANNPEATKFEDKPMWQSYLPEVDLVLSEAISDQKIERRIAIEPLQVERRKTGQEVKISYFFSRAFGVHIHLDARSKAADRQQANIVGKRGAPGQESPHL